MQKYIKLSEYAKNMGIGYHTAYRWYHKNKIDGAIQLDTGTILVPIKEDIEETGNKAVLYARVSSSTNKGPLEGQISRMRMYADLKGYEVVGEYKEIASGVNENRKQFNKVLDRQDYNILIIEHKDRLARFGTHYIEKMLERDRKMLDIVNKSNKTEQEELMEDFISIFYSFSSRMYGSARKKKTEQIIADLRGEQENGE